MILVGRPLAAAAAIRTWTGMAGTNWFDAANRDGALTLFSR